MPEKIWLILQKFFPLNKTKRFFIPAILWFVFSTILLIFPGSILPKENWLDKIWADKWAHIILFAILVILWIRTFHEQNPEKNTRKKIFFWLALSGIVYGIVMEFVQKFFIPNRSFDIGDIAADVVGCLVGFIYGIRKSI